MRTSDHQSTQVWQAAETRKKCGLSLTEKEKDRIRKNLPCAEDGSYYADAVFEGGGVKGTAFLGALRCFDDAGIKFRKVAGTSAGAITAALLAAGFSIEELETTIGELDYTKQFLNRKTSPFIFNKSPDDDLASCNCSTGLTGTG